MGAVKIVDDDGDLVLHFAVQNPESLHILMTLLPEPERAIAVNLPNQYGYTALHHADNPESLKILLKHLPVGQRLAAMKVQTHVGYMPLNSIEDKPECLKVLLSLLPDPDKMALLKTVINERSILERLIEQKMELSASEEGFEESFVASFISISIYLLEQNNLQKANTDFFNHKNDAGQLIIDLNQYNSFDEIKTHLIDYVSKNPDAPFTKGMLIRLKTIDQCRLALNEVSPTTKRSDLSSTSTNSL